MTTGRSGPTQSNERGTGPAKSYFSADRSLLHLCQVCMLSYLVPGPSLFKNYHSQNFSHSFKTKILIPNASELSYSNNTAPTFNPISSTFFRSSLLHQAKPPNSSDTPCLLTPQALEAYGMVLSISSGKASEVSRQTSNMKSWLPPSVKTVLDRWAGTGNTTNGFPPVGAWVSDCFVFCKAFNLNTLYSIRDLNFFGEAPVFLCVLCCREMPSPMTSSR